MKNSQQGMSTLAILLVALIGVFFITCAIKLIPVYIGSATVSSTIESAIDEGEFNGLSTGQIRKKLVKYFRTNSVESIKARDIPITKKEGTVTIDARYASRVTLFANIDVVVKFDHFIFEFKQVSR